MAQQSVSSQASPGASASFENRHKLHKVNLASRQSNVKLLRGKDFHPVSFPERCPDTAGSWIHLIGGPAFSLMRHHFHPSEHSYRIL